MDGGSWLGRAGCGELKTSPAAASLGQGLVVLGGLRRLRRGGLEWVSQACWCPEERACPALTCLWLGLEIGRGGGWAPALARHSHSCLVYLNWYRRSSWTPSPGALAASLFSLLCSPRWPYTTSAFTTLTEVTYSSQLHTGKIFMVYSQITCGFLNFPLRSLQKADTIMSCFFLLQ